MGLKEWIFVPVIISDGVSTLLLIIILTHDRCLVNDRDRIGDKVVVKYWWTTKDYPNWVAATLAEEYRSGRETSSPEPRTDPSRRYRRDEKGGPKGTR